jgi:hypothetical protein
VAFFPSAFLKNIHLVFYPLYLLYLHLALVFRVLERTGWAHLAGAPALVTAGDDAYRRLDPPGTTPVPSIIYP